MQPCSGHGLSVRAVWIWNICTDAANGTKPWSVSTLLSWRMNSLTHWSKRPTYPCTSKRPQIGANYPEETFNKDLAPARQPCQLSSSWRIIWSTSGQLRCPCAQVRRRTVEEAFIRPRIEGFFSGGDRISGTPRTARGGSGSAVPREKTTERTCWLACGFALLPVTALRNLHVDFKNNVRRCLITKGD